MSDGCNHFSFSGASGNFKMSPSLPGPPGPPGKSAYEAAVEGGYTGTEAEFNAALAEVDTALQPSDVDAELSDSSENPVQNKVIAAALDNKASVITDTASGAVASFPDGADGMPIKSLKVNIDPLQSGSGDPSPENIRPISGWTGCNISHSGEDTSNPTVIAINWQTEAGTVYYGSFNIKTGIMTVEGGVNVYDGVNSVGVTAPEGGVVNLGKVTDTGRAGPDYYSFYTTNIRIGNFGSSTARILTPQEMSDGGFLCSNMPLCTMFETGDPTTNAQYAVGARLTAAGNVRIYIYARADTGITTVNAMNAKLAEWYGSNTPFAYCFKLKTPFTVQLSPGQLFSTLYGVNNIWADCGRVSVEYPVDTKSAIDKQAADIGELKSAIGTFDNRVEQQSIWQHGTIRADGTFYGGSQNRITCDYVYLPKGSLLYIEAVPESTQHSIMVSRFDGTFSLVEQTDYLWNYAMPDNGFVRVTARNNDNSTITTVSDVSSLVHQTINHANLKRKTELFPSIAHRGYSSIAPENTMPAFKSAFNAGFTHFECDVCKTSDGQFVLLHDDTINRTARNADGTELSSTVYIKDITYAQAQEYDFGIWKGEAFAGTKIPKLEEALEFARSVGIGIYLDLKPSAEFSRDDIEDIIDLVDSYGMMDNVVFLTATVVYGYYASLHNKKASIALVGDITEYNITHARAWVTGENHVFFSSNYENVDAEDIPDLIAAGFALEAWTVNSTSALGNLDEYVSGVTSDNLVAYKILASNSIETIWNTPNIVNNRIAIDGGGYSEVGNKVQVEMQVTPLSGNNSQPSIMSGFPVPQHAEALTAICITDTANWVFETVACTLKTNGYLIVDKMTANKPILINGEYTKKSS